MLKCEMNSSRTHLQRRDEIYVSIKHRTRWKWNKKTADVLLLAHQSSSHRSLSTSYFLSIEILLSEFTMIKWLLFNKLENDFCPSHWTWQSHERANTINRDWTCVCVCCMDPVIWFISARFYSMKSGFHCTKHPITHISRNNTPYMHTASIA